MESLSRKGARLWRTSCLETKQGFCIQVWCFWICRCTKLTELWKSLCFVLNPKCRNGTAKCVCLSQKEWMAHAKDPNFQKMSSKTKHTHTQFLTRSSCQIGRSDSWGASELNQDDGGLKKLRSWVSCTHSACGNRCELELPSSLSENCASLTLQVTDIKRVFLPGKPTCCARYTCFVQRHEQNNTEQSVCAFAAVQRYTYLWQREYAAIETAFLESRQEYHFREQTRKLSSKNRQFFLSYRYLWVQWCAVFHNFRHFSVPTSLAFERNQTPLPWNSKGQQETKRM